MAIQTKVFPLDASGLTGGPRFRTDVFAGANEQEVRNALWQDPLWRYNAAFTVRTRADVETLRNFFINCRGREQAFLLEAKDDYKIPSSGSTPQLIGTGDGSDATWQITKTYTDAVATYTRTILRPSTTPADLAVYVNDVLKTHTTHYTYSTTTGIITFTGGSIPPNGHTIKITLAKFYTIVRFDVDEFDVDMFNHWISAGADASLHQIPDLPLVEVRDTT